MLQLRRVGTTTINSAKQPVFEIPNDSGQYVRHDNLLISVEGAKAFKGGQYPLHPDIRPAVASELGGAVPFPLRSGDERTASAQVILKAMMKRMLAVDLPGRAA